MPFYKDLNNGVHCLDSADFVSLLPPGCVEITEAQAADLLPKPPPNADILQQIGTLEASVTARRLREAGLTDAGKSWLADVDLQISVLRTKLV